MCRPSDLLSTDPCAELLRDETSELDLVGPTLQALKALLDRPANLPDPDNKFGRIVHGLLSTCLVNIDEMRWATYFVQQSLCVLNCTDSGREGPMCNKKIKCNLLAAVLVLTVLPATVPVGKPVIEHACFLISQKLVEGSEVSDSDTWLSACVSVVLVRTHAISVDLIDSCSLREDAYHGIGVGQPGSSPMHATALARFGGMPSEGSCGK